MKKISSNTLLLVFSTIGLFIYSVIYACSDNGDWDWFFDSNFTPETFVDKSYSPLFLSADVFYGIGFDQEHNTRFNEEIVNDWSLYLEGKMDVQQVKFFLLDSSAVTVNKIYSSLKYKKSNSVATKWSKKINLKDVKVFNFFEFLHHAQALEKVSISTENWSYEPQKTVFFNNSERVKSIERQYNITTDSFLKNRYWFLTIKANFYSNYKENTDLFFAKTESSVPKNTLYYRAVSYLAGLEYRNKNYAKSNYQYAQIFDKCPQLRVVTAYSFHPQNQEDWNQSLAMAKNDTEKIALWAIHGFYADEENAIQKIYELDPKSEHLNYLLTRLINKVEKKIDKSFKDQNVVQNKQKIKDSISGTPIQLVVSIAEANKTAKPYLWNIAAGYLETLNGDFVQANTKYDKAELTMPKTALAISQLRLLRFVNNLSKVDTINLTTEKTILADLNWLYFEVPKVDLSNFRYQNATLWSKKYLAALYKTQNNNVMAELFNKESDFYENEKRLIAMKNFLNSQSLSSIENIAKMIYDLNLNDINKYQAVKATFANKIPEAITFIKQSDSLQEIVFYGNPFNGRIKDCHDCEHAETQSKKFTQIDFLNTIKTMQDKIEKQEDIYQNALLLGNAFYNITYYGNARLFYQGNIVGYESSVYDMRNYNKNLITDCSIAKMYYQKAFESALTDEQKAKSQYMLAKCERNDFYNNKYKGVASWWEMDDEKINFLAWNGFKNLKNNYSNTQYYREVIAECGYFKTYIKQ
ncbi:hypothetical protein RCH18_000228 [Flavobacterium sp. PL11]|uniref:hypothetical protein n=1 Tax=Flavobacterium sp. PL11 TaxID=3071717 RepID=UPI002E0C7EDE|nr:hypothetical protein [Flavobacterium sp. PL11]